MRDKRLLERRTYPEPERTSEGAHPLALQLSGQELFLLNLVHPRSPLGRLYTQVDELTRSSLRRKHAQLAIIAARTRWHENLTPDEKLTDHLHRLRDLAIRGAIRLEQLQRGKKAA